MIRSLSWLILTASIVWISVAARAADAARPNVIFIMTDDEGSIDAGCYGAEDLQTPAIDELAAKGVRFTQFYAASPVCSPSRAALLTGRYPWEVGVPNLAQPAPSEKDDQLDNLTGSGIDGGVPNLAKAFRDAGYVTAHIGKWHLGSGQGHKPLDVGFQYSFGFLGGCVDNYTHFNYWNGPNRHDLWENNERVRLPGRFLADLMVEKAISYIEMQTSKPFFMYFAVSMPHYPYQGDPKWVSYYDEKGVPYPRNLYSAFLSTLDDRLARLMKYLDDTGLRRNTIIVLQSDNGHSNEERAHFGGGSSGIYRGAKFSVFEGGIRVPAIISWPAGLPGGEVRGQVAHGSDWMPTLAELCGLNIDAGKLDGRSLVEVIRSADAPSPHKVLLWRLANQWAVREGPWKLICDPRDTSTEEPVDVVDGHWFLANIDEDPGEKINLAASHPDIVARLKEKMPPEVEAAPRAKE